MDSVYRLVPTTAKCQPTTPKANIVTFRSIETMARKRRAASILTIVLLVLFNILVCIPDVQSNEDGSTATTNPKEQSSKPATLPNVLVFIVDDLGWNQVGYHASRVGNNEIQTPNINAAVAEGIEMNRGYVTPWWVNKHTTHKKKAHLSILTPDFNNVNIAILHQN